MKEKLKVWESFPKGEKHMRYLTVLFITAALAGIASADITLTVTQSIPDSPTGRVQNLISVNTTADWLSAQMIVESADWGATSPIFNSKAGAAAPYYSEFVGYMDEGIMANLFMEHDSFVTGGTDTGVDEWYPEQEYWVQATIGGGAVDLGGDTSASWTSTYINQAWWTDKTDDIGLTEIAQITIKDAAQGTWKLRATMSPAGGPYVEVLGGTIVDGVMIIPEPATMGLLLVGGLGVLIRRKR